MDITIPRGGKTSKTYNTTNLRIHLQKHATQCSELVANEEKKKKLAEEKDKGAEGKGTTSTIKKQLKKQLSVQESFQNVRLWDINSPQAEKITQLIAEMMVVDNQLTGLTKVKKTRGNR